MHDFLNHARLEPFEEVCARLAREDAPTPEIALFSAAIMRGLACALFGAGQVTIAHVDGFDVIGPAIERETPAPRCDCCGGETFRDGDLWQCGEEHCRNYFPVCQKNFAPPRLGVSSPATHNS